MKCNICGYEIPQGKKYCPGCGRVARAGTPSANNTSSDTMEFPKIKTAEDGTKVFRPASAGTGTPTQKTIHIPDIFNADPDAPVYTDPHSYDRATADVLEYDRMFMSKTNENAERPAPVRKTQTVAPAKQNTEKNIYYEDDYTDDSPVKEKKAAVSPERPAGPHLNINFKAIFIALGVIVGIIICVVGVYQIGGAFGFWDSNSKNPSSEVMSGEEAASKVDKNSETTTKKKPDSTTASSYKTGVYTVKSDLKNIFVYKSATDQRIIATIPNETVIEISEIDDDLGKTEYNGYEGWVEMEELEYSPSSDVDEEKTTKADDDEDNEDGEDDDENSDETTTQPPEPGAYVVRLDSANSDLNVRDKNSTEGEIISKLVEGDKVTVLEVKSSWGKIEIDGKEGWVYMGYLAAEE